MHLGSFTLRPRLEITEMGFDSNVFNDPVSPREDFTATITPRLGADFDVSWGRLRSSTYVDFVYFHEFDEERSFNRGIEGRLEFFADRFRPYIGGSAVITHARINAEVDARAAHQEWRVDAGRVVRDHSAHDDCRRRQPERAHVRGRRGLSGRGARRDAERRCESLRSGHAVRADAAHDASRSSPRASGIASTQPKNGMHARSGLSRASNSRRRR